jgi:hypothetical protein
MRTLPRFIAEKTAASIIPVVSGVSGKCNEGTSTTGSNSARGQMVSATPPPAVGWCR